MINDIPDLLQAAACKSLRQLAAALSAHSDVDVHIGVVLEDGSLVLDMTRAQDTIKWRKSQPIVGLFMHVSAPELGSETACMPLLFPFEETDIDARLSEADSRLEDESFCWQTANFELLQKFPTT